MILDRVKVKHVAKLASLPLTSEEEEKFAKELGETLDYVEKLDEVDTSGLEGTNQVTGLVNVTREDIVGHSLSQEEALSNAKETYKGFIKVKAILSEEM
jgi:aspartyl-tRNA(Asn)/glutamyl-tRNA(Gln) amidotransferase subunit C